MKKLLTALLLCGPFIYYYPYYCGWYCYPHYWCW
jgi:hypothetical protein